MKKTVPPNCNSSESRSLFGTPIILTYRFTSLGALVILTFLGLSLRFSPASPPEMFMTNLIEDFEDEFPIPTTSFSTDHPNFTADFMLTGDLVINSFSGFGSQGSDAYLESNEANAPYTLGSTVGAIQSDGTFTFIVDSLDLYLSTDGNIGNSESAMVRFIGTLPGGGTASADLVTGADNTYTEGVSFQGTDLENVPITELSIQLLGDVNYVALDKFAFQYLPDGTTFFTVNSIQATEGNSGTKTFTFNVSRNINTGAHDVTVQTADDVATAGSDYTAVGATVLSFAAGGDFSKTVDVTVSGDTGLEPDETFFVNLSSPTNGAMLQVSQGVGTILDDDERFETFEDELAGTTTFTEGGLTFNVTGVLVIGEVTSGGSGNSDFFLETEDTDAPHSGTVGTLSIGTGEFFTVQQLDLFLSDDMDLNTAETGTVRFTGTLAAGGTMSADLTSDGGFVWTEDLSFSGTDLENAVLSSLSIELLGDVNYLAIDNFAFAEATMMGAGNTPPTASSFTAANGPFENLTYTFATSDFGYMDDDSDPLDHIEITSLPTSGTLYLDADNDDTYDGGEEVAANDQVSKADLDAGNLQYIQNGSTNTSFQFRVNDGMEASVSSYTATLNVLPVPTVTLSVSPSSRLESLATANVVTATLSNAYGANVTVNLSFSGTATLTDDYTRSGTSITITPGNTTGTISLANVSDALYEGDETVVVDIASVTNGTESGTQSVSFEITDDDTPPTVTLMPSVTEITDESGGQAYVRGILSAEAGVAVTINLSFSGTATGGGTDYSITSTSITINPGETRDSMRITSQFDGIQEGTENILVDISNVTNGTEDGVQQISVDILDEDAVPEILIEDADGTAILAGDDSPSANESTDFGEVDVDGGSVDRTFTIKNEGLADLVLSGDPVLAFSGSDAFTVITAPALTNISGPNGSTTFTIRFDPVNTDCDDPLTTIVSIENNDADENPFTFTLQGTPIDNVDPVAACRDITVYLDATGNATISESDVDDSSSDNCAIHELSIDDDSFTCSDIGENTVVLTATDNAFNFDTCHATVTVQDTVSPMAICQDITVYLDGTGNVSFTADDIDNASTDACGIAELAIDIDAFNCDHIGPNTVELTATDNNTNTDTCHATVTVQDTVSPVAVCQDITVYLDNAGSLTLQASDIDAGSTDNCSIVDYGLNLTNFTCDVTGNNRVVLTVTDNYTNSDTCHAMVTVQDTVSPMAICQDITVYLDGTGNASITADDIDNASNDACGINDLAIDIDAFDCDDIGPNTVELTATDNNTNTGTCHATVTVQDTVSPQAICQDITVYLDGSGMATFTFGDIDGGSSDNCSINMSSLDITSFNCNDAGPQTVALTVTDNASNFDTCHATVTVQDTISPMAICQDVTVYLDETGNASITADDIDNASTDACGINDLAIDIDAFDCEDIGPNTVELIATDNNSNTGTCHATVTVQDTVSPMAICQDVTVYLDDSGNASITAGDIDNTSTDACGINELVIDINAFDCEDVGANMVVLTVTDNSTNSDTCHALVTVSDTISPQATCVPTFMIDLSGDGMASITAADINSGSSDACGIANLSLDKSDFDLEDIDQDNMVTLTVTDENGNESACTTEITLDLPDPITPTNIEREEVTETNLEETDEPPMIFDPCSCRDNTDSLSNGNFTNMGLFDDEIVVISATMGDVWEIQGTSDGKPLPYAYTPDPEAQVEDLSPINVGDPLNFVGSMMIEGELRYIYSLPIIHRDSLGYSVEVAETTGKYPDFSLTVDNECFYPDIYFDDLATGFLQSSDPLTITGRILNGADATGAFILEGDTLAQGPLPLELTLDFSTMETGPTELIFVADADTAGMNDLSDPGCRQKIYEPFVISDGNFACNGQVNMNLNNDCFIEPALVQLMRGRYVSSVSYLYDLTIAMDEETVPDNRITRPGLYTYRIDGPDGFVCWGMLQAEDKTPPVLEYTDFAQDTLFCTDLEAILNNPNTVETSDPNYTGRPYFRDACSEEYADFTFTDRVEYGDCEDGYAAQLFRTFTAADAGGLEVSTTQVITFVTPSLDSLIRIDEPVEIQTCDSEGVTAAAVWPFWINSFGDTVRLNEVECGYGIAVDSTVFPICGNEGRKIERYIRVFDWCADGTQYVDTVVVKIGDFEAPAYTGNALPLTHGTGSTQEQLTLVDRDSLLDLYDQGLISTISTDPFECTANFATNLGIMESTFGFEVLDCEVADYSLSIWNYGPRINHEFPLGDTMWRETNYPIINGAAVGIPVGVYALVLETNDGCYNHSKGVTFFKVQDQIAPTMSCDDNLNVTLSTAGYAKVFAEDIDEGTNDNCLLGDLQVRRSVSEDCMASGFFDIGELVLEDGVYYTAWSDYVEFYCCDLGVDPTVELRAMDQARDPLLQETAPNQNVCWMQLSLEDKLEPNCTDLAPVTTYCDDPQLNDLTSFGTPDVPFSNCDNIQAIELEAISDLDRCGFGTITRQFQAVKNLDTGNEERSDICTQVIEVVARHDYWLQFPADQTANCGDDLDIRGVEFAENACDLIAISHTDEEFLATQDPDACYKIFRTYRVINWCEYDGEAQPTIVSRDWDAWNDENPVSPDGDDNPGDEDIFVIVKRHFADGEPDTVYYDNNANPYDESVVDGDDTYGYWWNVVSGNNDPTTEYYYEGAPVSGEGPTICRSCFSTWAFDGDQEDSDISGNVQGDDNDYRYGSFGYWQYTQHIVVYDDVDPDLTVSTEDTFCSISNEDCASPVEFTFSASDLCTDDEDDVFVTVALDVNNDGSIDADVSSQIDGNTFSGRYPIGTHRLIFTANDGCGNTVQEERIFTVADCKAPTPIVIDAISVELTRTDEDTTGASAVAWVSDYIASPVYDCSGQGPDGEILRYSINRVGETPDSSVTGIYVNCTEAAQAIEIEIHAWDEAGNHGFVRTFLLVQDNMGACDQAAGEGQISGSVATEDGEMVNEVEVRLSGQGSATYVTNATGTFSFTGLEEDFDFSVIPRKNIYHSNGISTFDLVLMQKDILGIQPLTSPYRRIAADVNNSRSITTLDLIQLRKIILNIDVEFSNNTSWRFVDADFTFSNPESPWENGFPEVKNINNLEGEEIADFVAIKVGDVNGSAMAYVQPRSNRDWVVMLDGPQELRAGEEATLTFTNADLTAISGYQFTLQWNNDQMEVVDLLSGHARDEHFGWFADQGILTTSWTKPGRLEDHASLFQLRVRAKQNMLLSDAIALNSRYTAAEAYDEATGELMEVGLQISDEAFAKKETNLYQNRPNPFTGETVIGFELDRASTATIQIKDLTGRIVREIKGEYEAGYQEVRLKSDDLPGRGVFTYTLRAGETTITRKMVVLE